MNQRHTLGMTAAAATLLAAVPMSTIFVSYTWFFYAALAVAFIEGAAILTRQLRGPAWAQVLAMMGALLLFLTVAFPSGAEFGHILPTGSTFLNFNDLLVDAGDQIRSQAPPVPDLDGLLLLTTTGIGLVAMLVDLAAVGLRRPALAGLPMLALYSVPVAVIPAGLSFLPFVFAAAGFIWLLVSDSVDRVRRFGRRFTGEGRDVDVWEASPLSSAGRRLGFVGVVVAIVLPLAVPGMTAGLLDRFGTGDGPGLTGGSSIDGVGSTVDLNGFLEGNLLRDRPTTMIQVSTNDPAPFYLRIGVADQVTQQGFVGHPPVGTQLSSVPADFTPPNVSGVSANRYHADVKVFDLNMNLAPVYQQLVGIQHLDNGWFYEPSTDQIYSRRESVANAQYGLDYVRVNYTQNALRSAPPLAGADPIRTQAQVPANEFVSQLVSGLTKNATTEYDQVLALYSYFTNPASGFTYSLTTQKGTDDSLIVNFLTTKTGFCVQYAAALAWLVRAAGFPARVAFGFTRGNGLVNGVYTLTNYNLHAWTEVYFPDFGWVPFDATPAGAVSGSVQTGWAPPDPSQVNPSGSAGPVDVGNSRSAGPSSSAGAGGKDKNNANGDAAGAVGTWWLVGAAVLTLIVALFFLPAIRRRSLSRHRRARGGAFTVIGGDGRQPVRPEYEMLDPAAVDTARRDAHAAWAELRDTMLDFQVDVDDAETPRTTAERLNRVLASADSAPTATPTSDDGDVVTTTTARRAGRARHALPLADQTTLVARAEEHARYARVPLHPNGLDAAVVAVREALAGRATRRQRIAARILPRSELLRWRQAVITRMARASARLARIRTGASTVNPRRLLTRAAR